MRYLIFSIIVFLSYSNAIAQDILQVNVINDKVAFSVNEDIYFKVEVNDVTFSKLKNKELTISYAVEGDTDKEPISFNFLMKNNVEVIKINKISAAQILRIKTSLMYDKSLLTKEIGIAIDPERIATTVIKPHDFNTFWQEQIMNLDDIGLNPNVVQVPKLSTADYDVYNIDYQVDKDGSRFYGVLTIPKGATSKKYPAIVIYPGAGVRGYVADTRFVADSVITLQVGVHGIPIDLPAQLYNSLTNGALKGYPYFNLQSKELYYFNRVIKGSLRALDFLQTVEQFDGENILTTGSSQGGALSLIVTALDKRVKATAVFCPALCQTNGTLFGKATGWPQPMKRVKMGEECTQNWKDVIPYYDVVNFAKDINVPVFMTFGLIDNVTPATTIFAAYNAIPSDKKYYLMADVQHANHPIQMERVKEYILKKIK